MTLPDPEAVDPIASLGRLVDDPDLSVDTVELLFISAIDAGKALEAIDVLEARLGNPRRELSARDRFQLSLLLFDALSEAEPGTSRTAAAAAASLAAAAVAGGDAWQIALKPERFRRYEAQFDNHDYGLDVLEQLLYAPAGQGWTEIATAQLEAIAARSLPDAERTRSIETLLHATGSRDAAYRVEELRKAQEPRLRGPQLARKSSKARKPRFETIAIAGGHTALRVNSARQLSSRGVAVLEIPSSTEAVRRERDIAGVLGSSGLVVVLVRQISHTTSDQVKKVAARLGVPLVMSDALSASAIAREVAEAEETGG